MSVSLNHAVLTCFHDPNISKSSISSMNTRWLEVDHGLFHQWISLRFGHGLRPLSVRPRLRAPHAGLRQRLSGANGAGGDGAAHQPGRTPMG